MRFHIDSQFFYDCSREHISLIGSFSGLIIFSARSIVSSSFRSRAYSYYSSASHLDSTCSGVHVSHHPIRIAYRAAEQSGGDTINVCLAQHCSPLSVCTSLASLSTHSFPSDTNSSMPRDFNQNVNWNPSSTNYKGNAKPSAFQPATYPQQSSFPFPTQQQQQPVYYGAYPYPALPQTVSPPIRSPHAANALPLSLSGTPSIGTD